MSTAASGIRRGPRRADHFTILSNAVLNDDRISFRARGVLMWLLSKPADWRTRSEAIASQSPSEGRESIRTAMRELEALGYLVREKFQDERGRWNTIQTIFEEPAADGCAPDPERSPVPRPRKSGSGKPQPRKLGANQRIVLPRNETNHHQASAGTRTSKAEELDPVVVDELRDGRLDSLAAACRRAGLPARFDVLGAEKAHVIAELLAAHGVDRLVAHAVKVHSPTHPTRFAGGLIGAWQAMPQASTRTARAKCTECDGSGWVGADYDEACTSCRPHLATAEVAA